jgi:hypothetical protein
VCRALSLYPLPDLIVAADKFEPFTAESHDCKVINPGEKKLNTGTYSLLESYFGPRGTRTGIYLSGNILIPTFFVC